MSEFVIRTDGKTGELLVDGKRVELFGELVGVDVRRDVVRPFDPRLSLIAGLPVVEVTLRLPLKPSDTLTLLRDTQIEDVPGPTADSPHTWTAPVGGRYHVVGGREPHLVENCGEECAT